MNELKFVLHLGSVRKNVFKNVIAVTYVLLEPFRNSLALQFKKISNCWWWNYFSQLELFITFKLYHYRLIASDYYQ